MHLRDLEIFCAVATLRSFSKAAREHDVSQPVASETIKALEDHFEIELVDRSTRPLELTPGGRIFFEGARDLLEQYRRLEDRMLQLRDKVVGPVRVAAIYSVGLLEMDSYVQEFERLYPDAALELRYLHPDVVLEKVLDDSADMGLMSFPPKRADLCCVPWQEQELVLAVSPSHRLATRGTIHSQELDGEQFVAFTPELQIRSEIDRWFKQAKIHVDVIHEFDNIENIKRAVEIGSGVALLPIPSVRREVEIGSLRALRFDDVRWSRPLGIVFRKGRPQTAAVSRFLALLHQPPESFLFSSSRQDAVKIRQRAAMDAVPATNTSLATSE